MNLKSDAPMPWLKEFEIVPDRRFHPARNVPGTSPDAPVRLDLYRFVHKGLRAFLHDVLLQVGRMDVDDDAEVKGVLARVRDLLTICRIHLQEENRFIHTALEARRAGAATRVASDHASHEQSFEELELDARAVEDSQSPARAVAATRLYRHLALFVADNLEHMHVEETELNEALWATHSDAELRGIQQALVSAIAPEHMAVFQRWMLPAMTPAERVALLSGIKQRTPGHVFSGILANLKPHLAERDWNKLMAALAGL